MDNFGVPELKSPPGKTGPIMSQAVQDYVKAIYKLQLDDGTVSTTDISRRMRTSPAAASKMIRHLAASNLVDHTRYYGVRLTPSGERVALEIIRHHRLLELYLHEALGYAWDEVDAEAEKLEHHISEEFEDRIDRMLNYPQTDPHGDPIPTRDGTIAPARGIPLADALPGQRVFISRVRDSDPGVLRFLTSLGMRLGTQMTIKDKQPFNGPIVLSIGEHLHTIGRELAGHVFVEEMT